MLQRPDFLLIMAAVFALDALTGLVVIGYGNSYLINIVKAPESYPAYAIAVYGVVKMVVAPVGGWLLDRVRPSAIIIFSAAATALGLAVILSFKSAHVYLGAIALISLGQAFAWLIVFHILGDRHHEDERGAATASMGLVSAGATATGLGLAALLGDTTHWRVPFGAGFALALATAIVLLPSKGAPQAAGHSPHLPATNATPARRRTIATGLIFAHFAITSSLIAGLAPLMLKRLDLTLIQAGFALAPAAFGAVAGMYIFGSRSRAGGRLRQAGLLYLLAAAAIALIAVSPNGFVLAIGALPLGVALGGAQPVVNASLIDAARAEERSGVALGYLFFVEGLGSIAGPLLVGVAISLVAVRFGVMTIAAMAFAAAVMALATSREPRLQTVEPSRPST